MLCIDQYSSIFCLSWVILYEHNTFSIRVKCSVTMFKYCVLFKERYMKIWLSSLKENINVIFPRSCTIRVVAYCLLILKGLGLCLVLLLQFKDILPLWRNHGPLLDDTHEEGANRLTLWIDAGQTSLSTRTGLSLIFLLHFGVSSWNLD